jgi:uncharacterized coiled-coil protein SlyX
MSDIAFEHRLTVLEQKLEVQAGEVNSALSENRKTTQLLTQMTTVATKTITARLDVIEQFAEKVHAAIQDLNARLVQMEKPTLEEHVGIEQDGKL